MSGERIDEGVPAEHKLGACSWVDTQCQEAIRWLAVFSLPAVASQAASSGTCVVWPLRVRQVLFAVQWEGPMHAGGSHACMLCTGRRLLHASTGQDWMQPSSCAAAA